MSTSINIGGGFLSMLTIVFIAAKLWGKISWSWLWVLSPIWIGAAVGIVVLIFALLIWAIWRYFYLR